MFTKLKELISAFKDRPKNKIERKKRSIERQIEKWLPGYHVHIHRTQKARKEKSNGNEGSSNITEER